MVTTNKRILIVEDNETLAQMYVSYLDINGFVTETVGDGEKALSVALDFKPDLILLDIMMPKINGFDVLDILRNTPKTAGVPVIMLTALSEQEDKDRASKLGVDDYLEKSETDLSTIVEKIRIHLKMAESKEKPTS